MKLSDLRHRFVAVLFVSLLAPISACESTFVLAEPHGQGGQAGQAGAGGQADASTSSSSGGIAGAGGAGGHGTGGAGGVGGAEPCAEGQTQSCFTGDSHTLGVGECHAGVQSCVNGMFGACIGEATATSERCNGADDDCDGIIDDIIIVSIPSCSTGQLGVCRAGVLGCVDGQITCKPSKMPSAEICDGLDNDCNGQTDDGIACGGPP
ncbi:MAG TPA: MopE-related protein [Polyangium sp.]|nr:MopE-related protein [Polyangium sp.]